MTIDPYANETTVELPGGLWRQYKEALENAQGWTKHADFLRKRIEEHLGDAHAGLVGGEKVVTYRPTETFSVVALRKNYPELCQHFEYEKTQVVFDLDAFRKQHEDIAEQFRSRSFRVGPM